MSPTTAGPVGRRLYPRSCVHSIQVPRLEREDVNLAVKCAKGGANSALPTMTSLTPPTLRLPAPALVKKNSSTGKACESHQQSLAGHSFVSGDSGGGAAVNRGAAGPEVSLRPSCSEKAARHHKLTGAYKWFKISKAQSAHILHGNGTSNLPEALYEKWTSTLLQPSTFYMASLTDLVSWPPLQFQLHPFRHSIPVMRITSVVTIPEMKSLPSLDENHLGSSDP
ncbi:hypothetical protein BDK51DRAFT_50186 [Blyttiomyces helicus]|uniref:Uncharacterized protein n=1 Tax=Blyttiomyces helicus TaxID=388810 RepID=A0A4P9WKS5_9FUNG|nr:hypothetical protein BDK51DRAFT_50186 [Blyttiomyces helicus]|eukprot:RKO91780.1 hypothetical protein BDK51DRAFT_50186 [Blyttiomyces helicus]